MKYITLAIVALMSSSASAVKHHHHHHHHSNDLVGLSSQGIDKKTLMKGAHWRKAWPEGVTDTGHEDDLVLNLKGQKRKFKKPPPVYKYPWTLDSDIVDSQANLSKTESTMSHQLTGKTYNDRALKLLNEPSLVQIA